MLASALLASALAFTPADSTNAFSVASGFVAECTPRDAGTAKGRAAARWLRERIGKGGADAAIDVFTSPVPSGVAEFANVVVDFPSSGSDEWIVVMSHYDTAPGIDIGFQGANDGASTCGLLVVLSGLIQKAGPEWRRFPVSLVFTDAEEKRLAYSFNDGLQGSRRLASFYSGHPTRKVRAAICLDMLGDRFLNITIPANGTPALKSLALKAASNAGVRKYVAPGKAAMNILDDHQPFLDAGFPAIDLIDFSYGSAPGLNDYWHTPNDTIDKVSPASLEKSGRLLVELLNLLQSVDVKAR